MATCKGCGKEIVWGIDEKGTKIPLDPRAPIYAFSFTGRVRGCRPVLRVRREEAAVSHRATCPKASQF